MAWNNFTTMGFLAVFAFSIMPFRNAALSAERDVMLLARDGRTDYSIEVATGDAVGGASAKELAGHLKASTGAVFPIVRPGERKSAHVIAVGPAAAKRLMPGLDVSLARLGNDGILMTASGEDMILTGAEGAKRGTLYAVYEFLESKVGCRWWTSRESYIPKNPNLAISAPDMVYVPKFWSREVFYKDVLENPVFATKCRSNGEWEKIPAEYGGHNSIVGHVHTFYKFLPSKKYFKDHPEWYSEIAGKRVGGNAQLCLTNEEMRREFVKVALERLRKEPGASLLAVSQNDCFNPCQCPVCLQLERQEGAPSGPMLKFVNQVAEDIEKEFPDVYVVTLAYQYTQKPPLTIKPRRNVIVQLCSIDCSFAQPLATGPRNEASKKDIEAWSAIAPQLFIWDYTANFFNYMLPHPNMRVLAPNVRFFVDHKVVGLFEQGDAGTPCGDFVELRAWLLSHLMWNPSLDEKALIKEFMDGYYGAASEPLRKYLDVVHDAAERRNIFLKVYMADVRWLSVDDLNQADALFADAERLVKENPVLSRRVRKAKISLDFAWVTRYRTLRFEAKASGVEFRGPSKADMDKRCAGFIKFVAESDVRQQYMEGKRFKSIEPGLKRRFDSIPPKECAGLAEDEWLSISIEDLEFWGGGRFIEDQKASTEMAVDVKIAGDRPGRVAQYRLLPSLKGLRCHVVVRCAFKEGAKKDGIAFEAGIGNNGNSRLDRPLPIQAASAMDGEYHTYDLGVCRPDDGFVWIGPVANKDVEAVYVDRIFFVREGR